MAGGKPPDWAAKQVRQEVLVDQRRFLWQRDTLDRLAAWIGLHPGMQVLDVGCGHGYMGWAYWRYFREGGSYTGLDASTPLLRHARKESGWADGGPVAFVAGDAARLPFPDGASLDGVPTLLCTPGTGSRTGGNGPGHTTRRHDHLP